MKKDWKETALAGAVLAGAYIGMRAAAKRWADDKNIDDGNPYMDSPLSGEEKKRMNLYADTVKPALDRVLSFGGLVALSPLLAVISAAVWVDDPGPVLFTQKRIGRDKHYIMIHKFRTMAAATPHDVPTHKLENPEQYITRVGKILRKTSLDELPQIWDIFRGKMSVIGPRPALWNQDDLVAERDKYGANHVMPGLTGLAQISGRDELEISVKAKYDGAYVKELNAGHGRGFRMDMWCFLDTIRSVLRNDGVVEGGTGTLNKTSV